MERERGGERERECVTSESRAHDIRPRGARMQSLCSRRDLGALCSHSLSVQRGRVFLCPRKTAPRDLTLGRSRRCHVTSSNKQNLVAAAVVVVVYVAIVFEVKMVCILILQVQSHATILSERGNQQLLYLLFIKSLACY